MFIQANKNITHKVAIKKWKNAATKIRFAIKLVKLKFNKYN